jgi:opacity protein-like surface antigen
MKKIIPIVLFMLGLLTFTASAQDASDRAAIKNSFGIGPRLGFYKAQDAEEGSFYGGLQARARLGAVVGLEGAVDYRAGQEYGFGDYTVKTSSIPVTASLMLFAPISKSFSPYGLAGIGAYYTRYDYSGSLAGLEAEDDSDFNLGYHLGFGAELPFNENVALNVDYRYIFLNPDSNEQSFEDANFNANAFTAGLMFYF